MNIKGHASNNLRDLSLMETELERLDGGTVAFKVLLEIYNPPMDVHGGVVEIGIAEAVLSLDAAGLAVIPDTRYGRRIRPAALEITKSSEKSQSSGRKSDVKNKAVLGGGTSLAGGKLSGSLEAERNTSNSADEGQKHNVSIKDDAPLIQAIGNNNWKLQEVEGPLNGVYCDKVTLCEVAEIQQSNRKTLTLALWVNAHQIRYKFVPNAPKPTWKERFCGLEKNNIEKMKQLVITSSLHNSANNQRYEGKLTLARSVHDDWED